MTERLWTIRLARLSDCDALSTIEIAAASLFRNADDVSWLADAPPLPSTLQQRLIEHGTVLVATDGKGQPIGFLSADALQDRLHIIEVSVLPDWQRLGIGRALIDVAKELAIKHGLRALTLTTFRHLPWNAPFYAELGFEETEDKALKQHLDDDATHGLPREHRCAMALAL
ncbi:GNAT family N-acetyltransferase [Rhizobium sp.]|jgi:GNAT superfamily N-acetyltransferase|uniref:GNAT family N-acetyltransferase n=1 Tax=Rhizobium sp. TaxID=391 RepID=UPI000E889C29|nr:GNAT family N-acetyltransferase [Rhizobium sp.]